eukprot:jgi/Tetstr1/437210/TSEL_025940.t1
MLKSKVNAAYPGKFDITANEEDVLKQTVPEGAGWEGALWRKGAFEIMRKDTGEVLYSKLGEGAHLVDGKGGPEGKLTQFIEGKLAEIN